MTGRGIPTRSHSPGKERVTIPDRRNESIGENDLRDHIVMRIDMGVDAKIESRCAEPSDDIVDVGDEADVDSRCSLAQSCDQRERQGGDDGVVGTDHESSLDDAWVSGQAGLEDGHGGVERTASGFAKADGDVRRHHRPARTDEQGITDDEPKASE
ncbi:MAG: hypothetical protein RIS33_1855 [Actinomycetota bacterium]